MFTRYTEYWTICCCLSTTWRLTYCSTASANICTAGNCFQMQRLSCVPAPVCSAPSLFMRHYHPVKEHQTVITNKEKCRRDKFTFSGFSGFMRRMALTMQWELRQDESVKSCKMSLNWKVTQKNTSFTLRAFKGVWNSHIHSFFKGTSKNGLRLR